MAHEVERSLWPFVHLSLYVCRWWGSGTDVTRIQRVAGVLGRVGEAVKADLGRKHGMIFVNWLINLF